MFNDYSKIEVLGDLERLQLALEGLDDETLKKRLETRRGNGRNDYPVRVLWNLIIAMKVFGHRTVASFRRELGRNSQLRKICGLNDFGRKKHLVPPDRVFTKFIKLLSGEQEVIDRMFTETVVRLREEMASFGESLAGDGKFLDSYDKIYKICISYDERVFLPLARDSTKFARLYKGRTAVERLNGWLDGDFMLVLITCFSFSNASQAKSFAITRR